MDPRFIKEKPIDTEWHRGVLDPSIDIEDQPCLVWRGDNQLLHIGDIQMIEGQAGSRKTFLQSAIAAAALGGDARNCLGFEYRMDEPARVAVVDTEQALSNVQRMQRRVLRMSGRPDRVADDCLRVVSCRELAPRDRVRWVDCIVQQYQPKLLVIDNIKDLMVDFNDIAESQLLVGRLMQWASTGMSVLCVLHQNRGTDKARGHVGSLMYEKCSLALTLEAKEQETKVHYSKIRNTPPEGFAFQVNDYGYPVLAQNSVSLPANTSGKWKAQFAELIGDGSIERGRLLRMYSNRYRVGQRSAQRSVKAALESGAIVEDNGYISMCVDALLSDPFPVSMFSAP